MNELTAQVKQLTSEKTRHQQIISNLQKELKSTQAAEAHGKNKLTAEVKQLKAEKLKQEQTISSLQKDFKAAMEESNKKDSELQEFKKKGRSLVA